MTIPTVIVIGNEGKGISRVVKEACGFPRYHPYVWNLNSLNASVAAAVPCMKWFVNDKRNNYVKDILIVDGYNVISARTHLKKLAHESLEHARMEL